MRIGFDQRRRMGKGPRRGSTRLTFFIDIIWLVYSPTLPLVAAE